MSTLVDLDMGDGWTVDATEHEGDGHASVALRDGVTGDQLVLRGDLARLVDLLEDALAGLVDHQVVAASESAPTSDRRVTPDEMEEGGWVRLPDELRWRQVTGVTAALVGLRSIWFVGRRPYILPHFTRLPYLTAQEMAAVADEEAA